MGNCIIHHLLSKQEKHHCRRHVAAVSDSDTASFSKHQYPDTDLFSGQNYYSSKSQISDAKQGGQQVKRIKIVISKQELKAMLLKGGEPVDLIVPKQMKTSNEADSHKSHAGWKPTLERIAEEIF